MQSQPSNSLKIKPYKGEQYDDELTRMLPLILHLGAQEDVRPTVSKFKEFLSSTTKEKSNGVCVCDTFVGSNDLKKIGSTSHLPEHLLVSFGFKRAICCKDRKVCELGVTSKSLLAPESSRSRFFSDSLEKSPRRRFSDSKVLGPSIPKTRANMVYLTPILPTCNVSGI